MRGFVVFLCYWAVSSAYILRQEKDEEWKTRKTTPPRGESKLREEQSGPKTSRYDTKRLFLSHNFFFSYFNSDVHLSLLTFKKRGKTVWLRLELHLKQLAMRNK